MDPRQSSPDSTEEWVAAFIQYEKAEQVAFNHIQNWMNQTILFVEQARGRHEHHNRVVHNRQYNYRERQEGEAILMKQYFVDRSVFKATEFRQRFRMQRHLFMRILEGIQRVNPYFVQRPGCRGVLGLSGHQKMTCALRMMAYNMPADATDEYIRIGTTTTIESMKICCKTIIHMYGAEYLRRPNANDVQRLLDDNAQRGFPRMLGSIDCMHWRWKNCPVQWKGSHVGHCGSKPTVILEAVADQHGWFWHANFGLPESLNDLNVFYGTDLFNQVLSGSAPPCNYTVNGRTYDMGYYLGDGIYPLIGTIVKAIKRPPPGTPEAKFTKHQESIRKDVERAFGMLQARFSYIREPCRYLEPNVLCHIMKASIILNNMIVEDERYNRTLESPYTFEHALQPNPDAISNQQLHTASEIYRRVYSKTLHGQLQQDLVACMFGKMLTKYGVLGVPFTTSS